MIKRGDKGTIKGSPARVIADDLVSIESLAIAVTSKGNTQVEYVVTRKPDGSSCIEEPFILAKPWDSLKPGDACFVRNSDTYVWYPRVFAGVSLDGKPRTFGEPSIYLWSYCVPAKLIDGELVPVEEE